MKKHLNKFYFTLIIIISLIIISGVSYFSLLYVRKNLSTLLYAHGASLSRTIIEGSRSLFYSQVDQEKSIARNLLALTNRFNNKLSSEDIETLEDEGYPLIIALDSSLEKTYESHVNDPAIAEWKNQYFEFVETVVDSNINEYLFGIDLDFPGSDVARGIVIKRDDMYFVIFAPLISNSSDIRKQGLGYLIRDVGSEPSIQYIVLQNPHGPVLASRGVSKISTFSSDKFLLKSIEQDQSLGRFHKFEDSKIYEVVTPFPMMGEFWGILRVGIRLDQYKGVQIALLIPLITICILLIVMFMLFLNTRMLLRRLRKAEAFTSGMRNRTALLFFETDENGTIIEMNHHARVLAGSSSEKFDNIQSLLGESRWGKLIRKKSCTLSNVCFDSRMFNIMGEAIDKDANGQITGYIIIAEDVSELFDLRKRTENLQHLEGLSELTATIAHDIRNPLNAISIASQKLEMKIPEEEQDQQELLNTLQFEIASLNRMIEEFLSISAPISIKTDEVLLSEFFDKLADYAKFISEEQNITVETYPEFGNLTGYLDTQRLARAIGNIIKNGIEASSENGILALHGYVNEHSLIIEIENFNNRIPQDTLEQLFMPVASKKSGGYGLGLFSSYRIVRTHNGDITVISDDEHTVFKITVPYKDRQDF